MDEYNRHTLHEILKELNVCSVVITGHAGTCV